MFAARLGCEDRFAQNDLYRVVAAVDEDDLPQMRSEASDAWKRTRSAVSSGVPNR
jgi:hypothetical protein